MSDDRPLLRVQGVTKKFGAVTALNDISLELHHGRIDSIIGPNGAGKTTLFNAISGFSHADSGTTTFNGRDITRMEPYAIARLGLVRTFQTARPLRDRNVFENVLAGCYPSGSGGVFASLLPGHRTRVRERGYAKRSLEALERVGLLGESALYPDELAAGQLRLLEIGRALVTGANVLLLDEPAAGLNKVETSRLEDTLRVIRESGTTILLVEHDVDLVLRLSDHVTVLDFGRLLKEGSAEEIRKDPDVAAAYFGIGDGADQHENEGSSSWQT